MPAVTHGAERVAANILARWHSATLVSLPVNDHTAAVLAFREQRLAGVIILTIAPEGDRISKIHVIADPAKLAFLRDQLRDGR